MRRVQHGRGRRRHPGGVRAGHRMADLLGQHIGHQIRHRPHALADLRPPLEAAGKADIDVPVFIGLDPGRGLHVGLADHRARFHRRVHLITGAVQETGIDESDPVLGGADTLLEVDGGPAFLVHNADLEGIGRHSKHRLDPREGLAREGDFLGPVHLGFDDVDRAGSGIRQPAKPVDVVHGDQGGEHGVHQPLGHFFTVLVQDRRVGHQMTNIAHQHQRATMQREGRAVRRLIIAIRVEGPSHCPAGLLETVRQIALHQTQPIGIGQDLVLGVDRGNAILAIHDRGDGRLDEHVGDMGRVPGADGGAGVDDDLHMQIVVAQQDRLRLHPAAAITGERRLRRESRAGAIAERDDKRALLDPIADRVDMAAAGERRNPVKERARPGNDRRASGRVIGANAVATLRLVNRVGAVERVIETAPACVGGV